MTAIIALIVILLIMIVLPITLALVIGSLTECWWSVLITDTFSRIRAWVVSILL